MHTQEWTKGHPEIVWEETYLYNLRSSHQEITEFCQYWQLKWLRGQRYCFRLVAISCLLKEKVQPFQQRNSRLCLASHKNPFKSIFYLCVATADVPISRSVCLKSKNYCKVTELLSNSLPSVKGIWKMKQISQLKR